MTFFQGLGLAAVLYVLLLARSAWKQGEFAQFVRSLAVVVGLGAALALVVVLTIALQG